MTTSSESLLRQQIDSWMQAVRERDIDAIVAPYAEDVVAFDAIQALHFKGKAAYRAHWEACMAFCPDGAIFDMEQLQVHASPELAIAHWLNRCGSAEEGAEGGCYMRVTAGYQRIDGEWKVIHEHWSAPFDMETGAALFTLKP